MDAVDYFITVRIGQFLLNFNIKKLCFTRSMGILICSSIMNDTEITLPEAAELIDLTFLDCWTHSFMIFLLL